ncbi:LamG-like jellyroll fold domain-containing protein [Verrucomicrobiota bacterium]
MRSFLTMDYADGKVGSWKTSRAFAGLCLLLLVTSSCNGKKADSGPGSTGAPDPAATELRDVTKSHTRVVWCQDVGDGTDTFGGGDQLRLMGYDTDDGRGERVILSKPSNYSRPMLTPGGDRVIFSNLREGKVYIVNWDGSGLKELDNGFAVSVWADPENGTEWFYAGTKVKNAGAVHSVRRYPIDRPETSELVWDRTFIDISNVQLSADGRRSSGAFPWPACGIAELPNQGWKKYANGCWPSLAPDNSYRLWIFDGSHRNITMFTPDSEERWVLSINTAPGFNGLEVYHPRWSNHARFMTVTGPYKVGASANRIRGGGPEVEIYVGRFDSEFKTIERWVRVTHNTRADFFPDVWMATGLETRSQPARDDSCRPGRSEISLPETTRVGQGSQRLKAPIAWPGDTRGLVFLWENRSKNNEITEAAGQSTRVCRAEPRGLARYGRYLEMDLTGGSFVAETGADTLLSECRKAGQLALEAVLIPKQTNAHGFAGIISFSSGTNALNFILGQKNDRLLFRLRTSQARENSKAVEMDLCRVSPGVPYHVVVSYTPGRLLCFLNGERVLSTDKVQGDFSNWNKRPLVFGDTGAGADDWSGTLEGIAIYSRVIEEKEAGQKFALYAPHLKKSVPAKRLVLDARLKQASGIPTPQAIVPYRRALVANQYEVVKVIEGRCAASEILVAHWAILDGRVLDTAKRRVGTIYRITLEPYDERPELEGERQVMDTDELLLPMYYDIGS